MDTERILPASVDNLWYPLKPGSVYVYRGVKDGESSREVMTVTHRTKVIDGFRGVGTVLEQTAKGPLERNELVSFRRGS
jgi:hypothetical protein